MVFQCEFSMNWYPFDTQLCKIVIQPQQGMQKLLSFHPKDLAYHGPMDLRQYVVKDVRTVQVNQNIELHLYLGRRLLSIFLTNILPTITFNCIGHAANYFKRDLFKAIIYLNVTVMLMITTMFISISNNLPKTAYVKMMDVWLLFNLSKPFIDVLLQTYMEYLRMDEDDKVIKNHGIGKSIKAAGDITQVAPVNLGYELDMKKGEVDPEMR